MASINPYLTFSGKAEEAFNFYKSVFGGDFIMLQRFKDTPESGQTDPKDSNLIMHVALPIGNSNILMASDVAGPMSDGFKEGNNISISIGADSKGEADKLYNGLAAGGKQTLPMADQFWGSYFGMLTDKFGINWMVSYDPK